MIVRHEPGTLVLITQPDHAALAARLMSAWQADGFPERPTRETVLLATREHDIGWEIEDASPQVDPVSHRPYDFINAPVGLRQGIWPRAMGTLAPRSPYAAALVAHHAVTIYRHYHGMPEWAPFFERMESERDRWFLEAEGRSGAAARTDAPPERGRLLHDYTILRIGDILSLIFCNGWSEPHEAEGYRAILRADRLVVSPDPFGGATVPFEIEGRRIDDRDYTSDSDLHQAVARAERVTLRGLAIGEPAAITP